MNRKYQVFISSSFVDLKGARQELMMSTLREGHIPFGMEMMKPGFRRTLTVIEERIKESDIFVVLVGARLGTRIGEQKNSLAFTEQEHEFAIKHDLPIIAFLLNDDDFKDARDEIPSDSDERTKEDDLLAFRKRVQEIEGGGTRTIGFFSYDDLGHLSELYSRAVADCIADREEQGPRGGWVKGEEFDILNNRIHLDTSVSSNPFFRDLAQQLNRFEKLSKRTTVAEYLKEGIASYFWRRYFAKLHEKQLDAIFFESGSSIAYVSREFIRQLRLQSDWFYDKGMNEKIRIRTNNALTYLDFLFQGSPWRPMDVRLQPHGSFSDDYGGTYGKLNFAVQESAPSPKDSLRTELPNDTQDIVNSVTEELRTELEPNGLILMTASGIDTRSESEKAPYPGPHVGSYPNMLLKRSLLSLSYPKVLFLHPEKLGFDFRFNNCHAVCDHSFPWDTIKSSSPLAIALATSSQSKQQQIANTLSNYGFTDIDLEEAQAGSPGPWSVIVANSKFTDFFKITR